MIKEQLKIKLIEAMKAKNENRKNILRLILGEVSTQETRNKKPLSDEDTRRIIKKFIQNGWDVMETLTKYNRQGEPLFQTTKDEEVILREFIPELLNKEQIVSNLGELSEQFKSAKSDGMAIGLATKHLKSKGFDFFGDEVANYVKEIKNS